ncbi:MAG: hypothetical protein DLM52_02055 [Chthoniobacterales bacterium]|nr:MAG: hypothetical protein DLM52_02055 [Chthoniobacterales bacterium]
MPNLGALGNPYRSFSPAEKTLLQLCPTIEGLTWTAPISLARAKIRSGDGSSRPYFRRWNSDDIHRNRGARFGAKSLAWLRNKRS